MQYYLNGFYPGDPTIQHAETGVGMPRTPLPDQVDVLIVGAGPAGLLLAAQLAQFPEIRTHLVERKEGPLELGQADGVACRTTEMLQAFGLADRLLSESYWVNETSFWRPACDDPTMIERVSRVPDTEDGLSEFPHVIMNQARIHDYLLDFMARSATQMVPHYGMELTELSVDRTLDHPVQVMLHDRATQTTRSVRARYVVGCDGARSQVRTQIDRTLTGDLAGHAWGVMDVLARSDFPDLRLKCAIQSAHAGSILIIPREGGYLVRLYVDLGVVDDGNRARVRSLSREQVVDVARRVLHPYSLDVAETVWFSIYEVAQRVTDAFNDASGRGVDPRVFIAGDACHTHSAKAGQGMNVSMQDSFNLGWKLAAVIRGHARASVLETYSTERQPVAQELIDFDQEWSAMMAEHPAPVGLSNQDSVQRVELADYYVRHGRYTAGLATTYPPGGLTGEGKHQALATGFQVGMKFHSSPVVRVADGCPLQLGHVAMADGRWRLYLFSDASMDGLWELCTWLTSSCASPLRIYRVPEEDIDARIDVRAVLQQEHEEIPVNQLPSLLRPQKGRYRLVDHEKAFAARGGRRVPDIFSERGIDREHGCMVLVRPDQYISDVLPLGDTDSLAELCSRFMRTPDPLDV